MNEGSEDDEEEVRGARKTQIQLWVKKQNKTKNKSNLVKRTLFTLSVFFSSLAVVVAAPVVITG